LRHLKSWARSCAPYAFWPVYAAGRPTKTGADERRALRDFGDCCIDAFQKMVRSGGEDYARRAAERRSSALAPDWNVLGYGNMAKPAGAGWHRDALNDHDFAPRYFPLCDFLAPGKRCDVKIPWEFSRLPWLLWHAEAIACGPERCRTSHVEAAKAIIEDWSAANRVGYGINWTCGMEVAIRGATLSIICGILVREMDDAGTDRLSGLLRVHQKFLARFPEVSDVPGNHYLANLMGTVVLHAALDGIRASATSDALYALAKAAELQFDADGCHIERSTIYHRLALEIIALPYALALRTGDPSVLMLGKVMQRAAAFMAQIADDGGNLPVFGDQDSGFVMWFGEAAQHADRRLSAAPEATETDLYNFLASLAGEAAFFPQVTREDGMRSGFGTISGTRFRATLKTGPIGLQGRAPHDHDDALSVHVSHGPCPLLIDPGSHSYTLDPAIRLESICSSRHNAPVPATRERHTPTMGSINATVRGAPTAQIIQHSDTVLIGRLERAEVASMGLTRALRVTECGLEISDYWRFDSAEGARVLWLLHPDWMVEVLPSTEIPPEGLLLTLTCEATRLSARVKAPAGSRLVVTIERYSPNYGAWANCPALRLMLPASTEAWASLILASAPEQEEQDPIPTRSRPGRA
jgi:hypothetical protein